MKISNHYSTIYRAVQVIVSSYFYRLSTHILANIFMGPASTTCCSFTTILVRRLLDISSIMSLMDSPAAEAVARAASITPPHRSWSGSEAVWARAAK